MGPIPCTSITKPETRHSTTTAYAARNKKRRKKEPKSSKQQDHSHLGSHLTFPIPPTSIHLNLPRSGVFFQLGASRIWIWPTLAGDLSIPCPSPALALSCLIPCPAHGVLRPLLSLGPAVHRPPEYIAQVLPLPQVYISACTYLCTSLYLDLYRSLPSPSLPAAARLLLLPHAGSASVLSHDITLLSLSLS